MPKFPCAARPRHVLLADLMAAPAAPLALPVCAQSFPAKPLRLIVAFPAGGSSCAP